MVSSARLESKRVMIDGSIGLFLLGGISELSYSNSGRVTRPRKIIKEETWYCSACEVSL